ncbi:MAG: shikimate kinase AroK [Gammaproteobacteria bacterium]|nr:shikimate kinase AroK [Gammaproteobacteria bacterium]MBT5205417.1 shikimate kinase AroK [Gammaproteobacteria bacterium]MBT5603918.1 shikimate kinase AroK [Gammaproteobacteria bacterium]MBT6245721.1 shikimate kinase AroK [Gammaproteobacteria bacterium]
MQTDKSLFLVGPMASGKTTVGQKLAKQLDLEFIDVDQEIVRRSGVSIAWIFDVEGEELFRERESRIIEELSLLPGLLLATGGGAILRAENRRCLIERGAVLFLDTTVDTQLNRTTYDTKRPLLQNVDKRKVLTKMKLERDPLYREVADVTVKVDNRSANRMIETIMAELLDIGVVSK